MVEKRKKGVKVERYTSVMEFKGSDHKPVSLPLTVLLLLAFYPLSVSLSEGAGTDHAYCEIECGSRSLPSLPFLVILDDHRTLFVCPCHLLSLSIRFGGGSNELER